MGHLQCSNDSTLMIKLSALKKKNTSKRIHYFNIIEKK